MLDKFYFVELQGGKGRPFDGMKAGKFVSMSGHAVEFPPADMSAYLTGTLAAIEATKSESGVVVGLPIDMKNHEHGDAAGWIINAEMTGDVIRLTSNWTKAGLDLIGAGLQRFFSPSVDMSNKAIIGGSLTNWPATRANGKNLLRPIELSQGVYSFETSLDERLASIYDAFDKAFNAEPAPGETETEYEVREVFDGYIIACEGEQLFRVTFTDDGAGNITFQPQAEWVKVKITYEDVAGTPAPEETPSPDAAPVETPAPAETTPVPAAPMSIPAESLTELTETQIAALVDERVNERLVELARIADRKRDTLAFSERVCNGTKDTPIGLAVPPADLCEILLALPDDGAAKVKTLLEHVVRVGVVNFSERGHSQITENKPELTGEPARLLRTWVNSGRKVSEFFTVNPELKLNPADFNLSEFQKG